MRILGSGRSLVVGLLVLAGYVLTGGACEQRGPNRLGAAGQGGDAVSGAAGSGSLGAAGADSTGAAGSDSTGAAGSDSTGAAGSDSTGAAGADSTGAAGADSTGAAGADSTGAAGADSTGAAGSDSTGAAGADSTGAAGTSGEGGTTGTAGSGATSTFSYPFDTSVEGWALNTYNDPNRKNLAASGSGSSPTLAWDSTAGDPANGSLKVTATFNDWKQFVDAVINPTPAKSLAGRTLRVRVQLVSGTFTGGAQIHAGTGSSYHYAAGTWTTLTAGHWVELTLDLDATHAADSAFDPTMVVQLGVKFDTGGDGGTSTFGSTANPVFQIDTFSDGS